MGSPLIGFACKIIRKIEPTPKAACNIDIIIGIDGNT